MNKSKFFGIIFIFIAVLIFLVVFIFLKNIENEENIIYESEELIDKTEDQEKYVGPSSIIERGVEVDDSVIVPPETENMPDKKEKAFVEVDMRTLITDENDFVPEVPSSVQKDFTQNNQREDSSDQPVIIQEENY